VSAPDNEVTKLLADYEQTAKYFFDLAATRFKLLAFVPTITGTVIGTLFGTWPQKPGLFAFVGAFGFIVSLGILFYDQRNTQIYDLMVLRAQCLEVLLGFPALTNHLYRTRECWRFGGAFLDRPPRSLWLVPIWPSKGLGIVRMWNDRGLALIYSTVLAGWTLLFTTGLAYPRVARGEIDFSRLILWAPPLGVLVYSLALLHLFDWCRQRTLGLPDKVNSLLGKSKRSSPGPLANFLCGMGYRGRSRTNGKRQKG